MTTLYLPAQQNRKLSTRAGPTDFTQQQNDKFTVKGMCWSNCHCSQSSVPLLENRFLTSIDLRHPTNFLCCVL